MNILIVGLGYAGNRFLRALQYVASQHQLTSSLSIAYVDKQQKKPDLPYFNTVSTALSSFQPDLIIVTVNDEFHAEILNQLTNFSGFVICEKPLANNKDDLNHLAENLSKISGFCFDLIERYAETTVCLKNYIKEHKLKLLRAHFYWGKDRINDYRPTCGVTSEVIHALDLIQYLTECRQDYKLSNALGTCSDFSISGSQVLDSVMLSAYLNEAVITGYSSFVNITRKREIDLTFTTSQHQLVYAHMVFDTPEWDIDYLRVWQKTRQGDDVLLELHTEKVTRNKQLQTIEKLCKLVNDVMLFIKYKAIPEQDFPDLAAALSLQKLLNSIESRVQTIGPITYTGPVREFLVDESDLERLG
ncbi:Gfo/Idh/MocA family oxidoreductase [Legionella sp. D16C41]|uniref:Gfo/Idh/MocA family oxidoreductase n=1 Tax=Legionella sp. D16C41 TaxID=3402688 RepID=UPI003AF4E3EA